MEEHLQIGPDLINMLLARYLKHTHQHAEHPRRNARKVSDILVETFMGYAVALHLEVAKQRCLLLGHAYEVDERIDVLDKNGAKVAHERVGEIVVGRVLSAENESLAVEHTTLGIVLQIKGHNVGASLIVYAMQSLARHWYKLTLVVGSARRLGIPFHGARP